MSASEFVTWAAADELGLLPDPILEAARDRSLLVNCHSGKSSTKATDFLPPAYFGVREESEEEVNTRMAVKLPSLVTALKHLSAMPRENK